LSVFKDLVSDHKVISFVGTGGVGKTTFSLATAIAAAKEGLKVAAITVDPSKRLSLSLGLQGGNDQKFSVDWSEFKGSLDVFALDTEQTFLRFIRTGLSDQSVDTLTKNKIFKQISKNLRETHNFAAIYRLFEVCKDQSYDLIVLDTPPSQAAIDFFEAPKKLNQFFSFDGFQGWGEKKSFRWIGSRGLSIVGPILKRLVGESFLDEMINFFKGVNHLKSEVQAVTSELLELLQGPEAQLVLITSPAKDKYHDAVKLVDKLSGQGFSIKKAVINQAYEDWLDQWGDSIEGGGEDWPIFLHYMIQQRAMAIEARTQMLQADFEEVFLLPKKDFKTFEKNEMLELARALKENW